MLLVVGLGNPGKRYAGNRHNIGFMAVEAVARAHGFGGWKRRYASRYSEGRLAGARTAALLPQTYMNACGPAVGQAMQAHKLQPQQVVVCHDDLDLQPGTVRVKTGGGHGGHNGLKSIDAQIGRNYRRVRLGIGHPGDKNRVTGYVLSDFARAEWDAIAPVLEAVAEAAPRLAEGADRAFQEAVAAAQPAR